MTERRRDRFGSARDARALAAAGPALAELREQLLVAPDDNVMAAHVEMMRLECQLLEPKPAPTFVVRWPAARRVSRQSWVTFPRRPACLIAAISLAVAGCSLDAVSALPEPLQNISNSIKHTLGIPVPPQPAPHTIKGSIGSLHSPPTTGSASHAPGSHGPTSAGGTAASANGGRSAARGSTSAADTTVPRPTTAPSTTPPNTGPPTTVGRPPTTAPPPKKNMPSWGGPPPGFPDNWQQLAIDSARGEVQQCASATTLTPAGCPQRAVSARPNGRTNEAHWLLLNQPLTGAVAVGQPTLGPVGENGAGTQVIVYGRFQMRGSYTVTGTGIPYLVYSAGLAQARVEWDGTSFQHLDADPITPADLPPGVTIKLYQRPTTVDDSRVLAETYAGLQNCATAVPITIDPSVPNCPQNNAIVSGSTNAQWLLVGDPMLAAHVTFDAETGAFIVRGSYAMQVTFDRADGHGRGMATVLGSYTAVLSFDGTIRLENITGS